MYPTKDILIQLLSEASEKGKNLGKTQLVKFLYLTEVESFRETSERLTDLQWLFYYYGPYAVELDSILSGREFEKTQFKTQQERDFTRIRVAEGMIPYNRKVDVKLTLLIKKIVRQWIDKPLEELLDYVYFETEPMQAVEKRGDVLDFTTIKKENAQVVIPLKASKETELKIAELRRRIAPTLKKLAEWRKVSEPTTEEYQEALRAWDEEETLDADALKRLKIIIKPNTDSGTQGN